MDIPLWIFALWPILGLICTVYLIYTESEYRDIKIADILVLLLTEIILGPFVFMWVLCDLLSKIKITDIIIIKKRK
jgi:hypothetical protein